MRKFTILIKKRKRSAQYAQIAWNTTEIGRQQRSTFDNLKDGFAIGFISPN